LRQAFQPIAYDVEGVFPMKKYYLSLLLGLLGTLTALAQPTITNGGILNAASYARPQLPNGAIARGSIFLVFGSGMGPAALQQVSSLPLPTTLGGTSIRVAAGGTNYDALMIYTSAGQLAAIMPSAVPAGSASVTVTFNGATSPPRTINVQNASFGAFTLNQGGNGPAVIQNFVSASEVPVNTARNSARPGQTVILYGTGLGPVTGNEAAGALPGDLASANVTVSVGGRPATVTYKGRSSSPGLDQINFVVPNDVANSCAAALLLSVNNVPANAITMSVNQTGGFCPANGLTSDQLRQALERGSLSVGNVALFSLVTSISIPILGEQNVASEIGSADFERYNPSQYDAGALDASEFDLTPGSCRYYSYTGTNTDEVNPVFGTGLNAGDRVTLNGPAGTRALLRQPNTPVGTYSATLSSSDNPLIPAPAFLAPGNITADNGGGGPDVGGFRTSITLPQPLVWTNRAAINTVQRSNGVTITWTGGGSGRLAYIFGTSGSAIDETNIAAGFVCVARSEAGTFTVPASITSALPASFTSSAGGITFETGFLGLGLFDPNPTRFEARGLDYGFFTAISTSGKSLGYR
jgi:uncharacterized protein (TIGR03437 family)